MNLGKIGEELTAQEYQRLGFNIVGKNIRFHGSRQIGEIDLIAVKDKEIVFVEVKTRRSNKFGTGAEAVNFTKQRKLIKSAKLYLLQHPQYDEWDWRIDVAEVDIDNREKPVIILVNVIDDI